MSDLEKVISEVETAEKIETIYAEFNRIIHRDLCKITRSSGGYHLVKENDDLEPIGNGGFANVYRQKSTGLVVKKLKDDYLTDLGIRSRFKREYNITKSFRGWKQANWYACYADFFASQWHSFKLYERRGCGSWSWCSFRNYAL